MDNVAICDKIDSLNRCIESLAEMMETLEKALESAEVPFYVAVAREIREYMEEIREDSNRLWENV